MPDPIEPYQPPLATHHPFKVGDRIHELECTWSYSHDGGKTFSPSEMVPSRWKPHAIVTELTPHGFVYRYTRRVPFIARDGSWFEGGECYESGYDQWRLVTEDSPSEPPDPFTVVPVVSATVST